MLRKNDKANDTSSIQGSIKRYLIVRELGSTKTHLYPVYLAYYFDPDRKETVNCVIKAISDLTAFKHELEIYGLKPHRSILKCIDVIENYTIDFGIYKNKSFNMLVFPYLENGSFIEVIEKYPLDEPTLRYYVEHLLDAIEYLHENGFAHRDIKPDNILLDDSFHPILIDFGHTVRHSNDKGPILFNAQTDRTTPGIIPPEFHKGVGYYGTRMDMFAFGKLLFNLATSLVPFASAKAGDPHFEIIAKGRWEDYWKMVKRNQRSMKILSSEPSSELKALIQGLLHPISDKRMTIEEVRASAWYQNTKPRSLEDIQCQMLKTKHST